MKENMMEVLFFKYYCDFYATPGYLQCSLILEQQRKTGALASPG
jgi:hypothetical protein